MKSQPPLSKKKMLIYSISIVALAISTYCLLLPLDKKLLLFCALDDDNFAQEPPLWIPGYWRIKYTEWVDGYWTSSRSGSNLTMIAIWEAIDGGMWVYYCNNEDIFWIGIQKGPEKGAFYGPYQGILWKLTNALNPLATIGIILSTIALLYSLIRRALPKNNPISTH